MKDNMIVILSAHPSIADQMYYDSKKTIPVNEYEIMVTNHTIYDPTLTSLRLLQTELYGALYEEIVIIRK